MSICFGVVGIVAPIPDALRPTLTMLAVIGLGVAGIGWWWAPKKDEIPSRGHLHLTVLNLDYENSAREIIADLLFFNNDSIERTVIGVTFLYRRSASEKGYEFYASGPNSAPFVGHINPLKIAAGGTETCHYSATIDPDRLQWNGAQIGLLITFTIPERGDESATVIPAMQVVKTGKLSTSSLSMPSIKNRSLDNIRDSRQLDAILEKMAPQPLTGWARLRHTRDRLFDW
ncbi:MAG: hypothetical protein QOH01_559 [Verrucomicrobiota bacterium]